MLNLSCDRGFSNVDCSESRTGRLRKAYELMFSLDSFHRCTNYRCLPRKFMKQNDLEGGQGEWMSHLLEESISRAVAYYAVRANSVNRDE